MGNFLFQSAAAMGYAWRHGMDYTLPSKTNDAKWNPIHLQHLVKPNFNPALPEVKLDEKTHGYQELPWQAEWKDRNVVLNGYWQTEKYFKEFRNEVLREFGFRWESRPGVVSVHVRRTDYITLTFKHPAVGKDWYVAAMRMFPGAQFCFFSDDIPWCQYTFGNRKDVSFSVAKNETEDLIEMSCCEHHICSASTFSWWGAWLNQNPRKRVIMPRDWFQPGYRKTNTRDIVPETWERL